MGTWWYMLLSDCLAPVLMILLGRFMWKHCPKEINGLIGYRTAGSMKNMDTWRFANEYAGKLWWRIGWIMIVPTVLSLVPFYGGESKVISNVGLVVLAVQITVLLVSIIPVEKALKKAFHDDGTRR